MKKLLILSLVLLAVAGCNRNKYPKNSVLISTKYGDMVVKLYDETPKHRDNFLKLVKEKYYDGTLFHRVIHEFMIQGGDPDSRKASQGQVLGEGGPGYDIPAEFNPALIHKKGVIAAAREGDEVNPQKASSGSQFYIVQGKAYTNPELTQLEQKINQRNLMKFFDQFLQKRENATYRAKLTEYRTKNDSISYMKLVNEIQPMVESEFAKTKPFKFTDQQRKVYTTVGGTPFLDGNYTVFGEVIKGLEVLDKIAAVKTDGNNRPAEDIKMTVTILK